MSAQSHEASLKILYSITVDFAFEQEADKYSVRCDWNLEGLCALPFATTCHFSLF